MENWTVSKYLSPGKSARVHNKLRNNSNKMCNAIPSIIVIILIVLIFLGIRITRMINPPKDNSYLTPGNNEFNFSFSNFNDSDYDALDTLPPWFEELLQKWSLEEAAEFLSSLNRSVDPCDNFYDFACQGWQEKYPRPDYISEWSVITKLTKETTDAVIKILQTPPIEEIAALIQAKHFYQTCINIDTNNHQHTNTSLQLMWETLEEVGGWPILYENGTWNKHRFDWVESTVGLQRILTTTPLLNVFPVQYPYWMQKMNTIHISPPTTSSTSGIDIFNKLVVDYTEFFKGKQNTLNVHKLIVNISKVFLEFQGKLDINQTYLEEQATDIIFVQAKINLLLDKGIVDPSFLKYWGVNKTNYLNTTVYNMQKMLDDYTLPYINKLNILQFLRSVYKNTNIWIEDSEPIVVTNLNYLLRVSKLITFTNDQALANFLHFRMILEMIPHSEHKILKNLLDEYENNYVGTNGKKDKKENCAEITEDKFLYAVGQAYVNSRHDVYSKFREVNLMFRNLKLAFFELIDNSHVPYFNKTRLLLQIQVTELCLGYPIWIKDNSKVQSEYDGLVFNQSTSFLEQIAEINLWLHTKKMGVLLDQLQNPMENEDDVCNWTYFPGDVGAYNALLEYLIYLPIGILQEPFFNGYLPMAINYGKLGSILGHELTHSLVGPGWSELVDGSLTPSGQCLKEQFDNFTTIYANNETLSLNGARTLKENIPDNVGLLAAHKALEKVRRKRGVVERNKKPVSLKSFSDDQLFFLGFAQNWCETATSNALLQRIQKNPHPPGMFRVLGTLKNSKEFAMAWKCPLGSNMNPNPVELEKCTVF